MKGEVNLSDSNFQAELDKWLGDGPVYWSDERNAWIVTGYDEAGTVLRDAKSFWRDAPERDGSFEFWGRHLMSLKDANHRHMHAVHMQLTSEGFANKQQARGVDICTEVVKGMVSRGSAELSTEYADTIPLLIGCDYLGLDLDDEPFMRALREQMDIRALWKEALHAGDGIPLNSEIAQNGLQAVNAIKKMLYPTILARRDQPKDDLISLLWKDGPSVFSDWNEEDIANTCWSSMDNEGKPFLRGLLCILCQSPALQARLRAEPSLVTNFVEEGLRFLAPFRTLIKTAQKDVSLGGRDIKKGDTVYVITALANRDSAKWSDPYEFDIDRSEKVTHYTFGFGPCYCVGRYVGRMEAAAAVTALLECTTEFKMDPDKPAPVWSGEVYHAAYPVHVLLKN